MKDGLRKSVLDIIQAQPVTKSFVGKVFQNESKPGVSPVRQMVEGGNQDLLYSEFTKQYGARAMNQTSCDVFKQLGVVTEKVQKRMPREASMVEIGAT